MSAAGKCGSYKKWARAALGFAGALLFPRRCPFCGRVIGFTACERCAAAAREVQRKTGEPIGKEGRCLSRLQAAFAPYWYEDPARSAILRLKFQKPDGTADFYAARMAEQLGGLPPDQKPDFLVFVPAYGADRRGRDNVPYLLARRLSALLQVPVCGGVLYKRHPTRRQIELSGAERRANVEGAYGVRAGALVRVQDACVWIVDDVLTTGSTLNACAKALLEAKARCCCGVTIAVTRESAL